MENKIEYGIMQSRLSSRPEHAYQAFPAKTWEEEFYFARELGFDYIEWIYDDNPLNVLRRASGPNEILKTGMFNRVLVRTICADYFIKENFTLNNPSKAIAELNHLLIQAFKLGVRHIVLPCLEESSLLAPGLISLFARNIQPCLDVARQYWVNICIESDLPPDGVIELLEACKSSRVKICYDTGNSAALGYDVLEEFGKYGKNIAHVHLKDRTKGGPNIEIGKGDCRFDLIFDLLRRIGYEGLYTLQSARGEDWQQLQFTRGQFIKVKSFV